MQAEWSSRAVSEEEEQVIADADANVSLPESEHSLDASPNLIRASGSILQDENSNVHFVLCVSFAEIFNEQIFDLLDLDTVSMTQPPTLLLGDGDAYIQGLCEVYMCSAEEAWRLVQLGRENQSHIASTCLNNDASPSGHSIFTVRLLRVVDIDQQAKSFPCRISVLL